MFRVSAKGIPAVSGGLCSDDCALVLACSCVARIGYTQDRPHAPSRRPVERPGKMVPTLRQHSQYNITSYNIIYCNIEFHNII